MTYKNMIAHFYKPILFNITSIQLTDNYDYNKYVTDKLSFNNLN